jgi:hypothetical protein
LNRSLPLAVAALTLLWFSGCESVKIRTGPTVETATESAEMQARKIRAEFHAGLVDAEPREMIQRLKVHVDSVSAVYVRYGRSIADEWRKGNDARGEQIPAAEMMETVKRWTATQKPILDAYEDNVEYALQEIERSRAFNQAVLRQTQEFADQLYRVRSAVFYPNGTVRDYEDALYDASAQTERMSRDMAQMIRRL